MRERRWAGVVVTGEALALMVSSRVGQLAVKSPVPDSAVFVNAYFAPSRGAFVVVFQDESFRPVPEGEKVPLLADVAQVLFCPQEGDKSARELELEDVLTSARAIAQRRGAETAWERFDARLAQLGIGSVTAKVFKILLSDLEE